MRFELNGSVVVSYRIQGVDDVLALTFAADEFSGIDIDNGFSNAGGALVYRGIWAANEENILVRLTIVATRDGFQEKRWEIEPNREPVIAPHIDDDKITCAFVDDENN